MIQYKDFKQAVITHLEKYKIKTLKISKCGVFDNKTYNHILPSADIKKNFLPMTYKNYGRWGIPVSDKNIKFHKYIAHLNSSQAMCINFFAPLLNDTDGINLLYEILNKAGIIRFTQSEITEATFEKVINAHERTNFDFYLKFNNEEQIFFEIKYTENGFGKINQKINYDEKWNNIYGNPDNHKGLLLKNMPSDVFYHDYQIWRNVFYIEKNTDYSVFLFPYDNPETSEDIKNTVKKRQKI